MVLNRRFFATLVVVLLWGSEASAERLVTRDALERLEELFEMRLDDGTLRKTEMVPALVVGLTVRYEESKGWFESEALSALTAALGKDALRMCEACMQPRIFSREGFLEHRTGPVGLDEIIRLDSGARGDAEPARTAIWLEEHETGVSIKGVDLATARIVWAENIDPTLRESADTADLMKLSAELERRQRGDSITHAFVDIAFIGLEGHFSLDWADQWGETNKNFTGFSLSLFDPVLGAGLVYYRVFDIFRVAGFPIAPQIGGKVLMSLPTAIVQGITDDPDADLIDPVVTGVFVIRVPIGGSNYALVATASTNGRFAIGISLLNISLLPVVP